jgi:branched-chain amino acid aminotransferase
MMEIQKDLLSAGERKEKPKQVEDLSFGSVFSDHMFTMRYSDGQWHSPLISGYSALELDPASLVLHYGQGIFEGMKAYRRNGDVYLFRPTQNISRFNNSASRMVMPPIDEDFMLDAIEELIRIEKEWIPSKSGTSLYIRPTMIATESKLGVKPSDEYIFFIILSPVGPYFKEGFKPIRIMIAEHHARAAPGGVGAAKTIGNYAASLKEEKRAKNSGYSQVLWLDACEKKYLEEVGTMNVFVAFEDEIVTPELGGTILPGITRDSVVTLLQDWGEQVTEREISVDELLAGHREDRLTEMFGCGTAAIIAPIGVLGYQGKEHIISNGRIGNITKRLYDELTGIQCGERKDNYGWVHRVR